MTICKFIGNWMFLLEVKKKTPKFPKTHTRKLKPSKERENKEYKEFMEKHGDIISQWMKLL